MSTDPDLTLSRANSASFAIASSCGCRWRKVLLALAGTAFFTSRTTARCALSALAARGGIALRSTSYGWLIHRAQALSTNCRSPLGATIVGERTFEINFKPAVAPSSSLAITSASHSRPAKSTLTRTPTRTSVSIRVGIK